MAEEEVTNSEKEQEDQGEAQKKAFPIKLIVMVLIAVLIIGGGILALKAGVLSGIFKQSETLASSSESTQQDIGPIYSLSTFIVNLVGDRGKSYLKAQLDLELSNETVKVEIDKRLPQFRDSVLTLLSSKSQNDIKTLEGKYQLREEITSTLNQYLVTGKVINVYFIDFIVQ